MANKRIIVEIGHPAHVHQFKHMYWELNKKGWTGIFVTKDKDCALDLLDHYAIPHVVIGKNRKGMFNKILSFPLYLYRILKVSYQFKPDIFVSRVSPLSGYASGVLRKPHITFTDTEDVQRLDFFSEPFASVILTSDAYLRDHGKKQLRYPGYHELAYLHPNRFTPDPNIKDRLGIGPDERYAILRFVSWAAHHDVGLTGISLQDKIKLVSRLSEHLRVFISSERELPPELKPYKLKIEAHKMHDILAGAHLYVGESGTMASECAVLGTPAILLEYSKDYGVIRDQCKYGLMHMFIYGEQEFEQALSLGVDIAANAMIKAEYSLKLKNMLNDKIDVSAFYAWFIDNYPDSIKETKSRSKLMEMFGRVNKEI